MCCGPPSISDRHLNIPSATRALYAIPTLAKQKQLVLSLRYFGLNTLVDSILFWPHFMQEVTLMGRHPSQASIQTDTKVSALIALNYKYCIMVRPMYMPWGCLFPPTNHGKCKLALDMADLILASAASDDGEIVLGSFRAQVKKAKEYYSKLEDWLPEKDVRYNEERMDQYNRVFTITAACQDYFRSKAPKIEGISLWANCRNMCHCCGKKNVKLLKFDGCGTMFY